jgi:DtxR family transcriptional regulator, Mn-dependent transcriptional regulator
VTELRSIPPSHAVEDYVKAIYALETRVHGPVSTNALAERLGVTTGSVSGMLRRLADIGLVSHERYRGVALTAQGRRVALRTLRNHRLIELLLVEILDVPWEQVHREAEELEHALSDELAERIAAKLGHPAVDPHGDPIPDADLTIAEVETRSLENVELGERVSFVRVSDADPDMLRYLSDRGVIPGVPVTVTDRQPFGGPLTVRVGDYEHHLGHQLAAAMRVAALPRRTHPGASSCSLPAR